MPAVSHCAVHLDSAFSFSQSVCPSFAWALAALGFNQPSFTSMLTLVQPLSLAVCHSGGWKMRQRRAVRSTQQPAATSRRPSRFASQSTASPTPSGLQDDADLREPASQASGSVQQATFNTHSSSGIHVTARLLCLPLTPGIACALSALFLRGQVGHASQVAQIILTVGAYDITLSLLSPFAHPHPVGA